MRNRVGSRAISLDLVFHPRAHRRRDAFAVRRPHGAHGRHSRVRHIHGDSSRPAVVHPPELVLVRRSVGVRHRVAPDPVRSSREEYGLAVPDSYRGFRGSWFRRLSAFRLSRPALLWRRVGRVWQARRQAIRRGVRFPPHRDCHALRLRPQRVGQLYRAHAGPLDRGEGMALRRRLVPRRRVRGAAVRRGALFELWRIQPRERAFTVDIPRRDELRDDSCHRDAARPIAAHAPLRASPRGAVRARRVHRRLSRDVLVASRRGEGAQE